MAGAQFLLPRLLRTEDSSAALAADEADGVGQGRIIAAAGARLDFRARGVFQITAFPGRQEEIGFDPRAAWYRGS